MPEASDSTRLTKPMRGTLFRCLWLTVAPVVTITNTKDSRALHPTTAIQWLQRKTSAELTMPQQNNATQLQICVLIIRSIAKSYEEK